MRYWQQRTSLNTNRDIFFSSNLCPLIIRKFEDGYVIYDTRLYSYNLKLKVSNEFRESLGKYFGYTLMSNKLKSLKYAKEKVNNILKGAKQ